jgi:hypothetical protein
MNMMQRPEVGDDGMPRVMNDAALAVQMENLNAMEQVRRAMLLLLRVVLRAADTVVRWLQYCQNEMDCRRVMILSHFGEVSFTKAGCRNTCDNCRCDYRCLSPAGVPAQPLSLFLTAVFLRPRRRGACYETVDASDLARVVLDLVMSKAGGAFTANQAVQVVQGSAKKMPCTVAVHLCVCVCVLCVTWCLVVCAAAAAAPPPISDVGG